MHHQLTCQKRNVILCTSNSNFELTLLVLSFPRVKGFLPYCTRTQTAKEKKNQMIGCVSPAISSRISIIPFCISYFWLLRFICWQEEGHSEFVVRFPVAYVPTCQNNNLDRLRKVISVLATPLMVTQEELVLFFLCALLLCMDKSSPWLQAGFRYFVLESRTK